MPTGTTAQGVLTHCSNGDFALTYTCSGPSCVAIGGVADTTCIGEDTDSLSCSNGVVCQGTPLFSSTFSLNQQDGVISQSDYYDFPGYGHYNYTSNSSGSDNGTISNLIEETTNVTSTVSTDMLSTLFTSPSQTTAQPQQNISTTATLSPSPMTTSTGYAQIIVSVGGFDSTTTVPASTSTIPGINSTATTAPYIAASVSSRRSRLSPSLYMITAVLLLSSIIPGILGATTESKSPGQGPPDVRHAIQTVPETAIALPVPKFPGTNAIAIRNSHSPSTDLALHDRGYFNSPLPDLFVSIASKLVRKANDIYNLAMTPQACAALSTDPWWLKTIHSSLDAVCLVVSQGLSLNKGVTTAFEKFTPWKLAAAATRVCTVDLNLFLLELSLGTAALVEFAAYFVSDILCKLLVDAIITSVSSVLDLACHGIGYLLDTALRPADMLPDKCKTLPSATSSLIWSTSSVSPKTSVAVPTAASTSIILDCDNDYDPGDPDENSECNPPSIGSTRTPTTMRAVSSSSNSVIVPTSTISPASNSFPTLPPSLSAAASTLAATTPPAAGATNSINNALPASLPPGVGTTPRIFPTSISTSITILHSRNGTSSSLALRISTTRA